MKLDAEYYRKKALAKAEIGAGEDEFEVMKEHFGSVGIEIPKEDIKKYGLDK